MVEEEFKRTKQNLTALFYMDDGLLNSPQSYCLQQVLDVQVRLLDRVGLSTNMEKIVGIVFQPCCTTVRQS